MHTAAGALFGEGSAGAKAWVEQRKTELWEGRLGEVVAALEREGARVRSPAKRRAVRQLRTYLENNRERVDYPRYRKLGLPCGSGQVEAQCKSLVGARCKLAGMRNWSYAGAEGVLRLRAALQEVLCPAVAAAAAGSRLTTQDLPPFRSCTPCECQRHFFLDRGFRRGQHVQQRWGE